MSEESKLLLQFLPFSSCIETTFWHKLTQLKIDIFALNDEPIDITGLYCNNAVTGLPACFNVGYSSFENLQVTKGCFVSHGVLCNKNTIEDFKNADKHTLINDIGRKIWEVIISGEAFHNPNLLSRFFLLTFADLKKYNFYYWFAFPALNFPTQVLLQENPKELGQVLTSEELEELQQEFDTFWNTNKEGFFIIDRNSSFQIHPLSKIQELDRDAVWIGFADPSTLSTNPGWPLRNLLALLAYHFKDKLSDLTILCWRDVTRDGVRKVDHSLVLKIQEVTIDLDHNALPKVIGWEKNDRGKLGPRLANLSATMDPHCLAESAVDLNLKLMKWRLLPDLNLEIVHQTRCLLIGAGTLGCYVARTLMAWGVRNITFVDNGHVAYSNPVRQSLFTFEDCLNGGQLKSECAAKALKKIFPGMNSCGIDLKIPMPGHFVVDTVKDSVESEVKQLEELINNHDAVFLLTDTRESRWLPTMLCALKGKLVINAALGFDTYLVMRHGQKEPWSPGKLDQKSQGVLRGPIAGQNLGCYFCNDVVAPGDSTRDRTLDQQCTVTRPGISLIASALAVELLVSILQHPDQGGAAAEPSAAEASSLIANSPLGFIPHSIRGFLHRHQQVLPAIECFDRCTACSALVLSRYATDGFSFLLQVFNQPDCLEQVTGLVDLHSETIDDMWEISDDEDEH